MTSIGNREAVIDNRDLYSLLLYRQKDERLDLSNRVIENADLSGKDLSNIDFSGTTFNSVSFDGADLDRSSLHKTWFTDSTMRGAKLTNADVTEAGLRYVDMTGTDISGSDMHAAILEYTILDDVKYDENTKWYKMVCPEEGAFIAWKCVCEYRVVQLLVPADAKRVAATMETGRCNRAKVLSIKSVDETQSFDWAQSTVDPDFYYETGKWVEPANGFEENRWMDSSPGIHFFMERQQCVDYMTK